MKRLLCALLFAASLAQASPTTITDVLYQPYNSLPAAGVNVTITQSAFFNAINNYFPAWSVTIHPVTDASGNLSVQLEPNPAGQPYLVILQYPNGVTTKEYWNVPASGTPLTIRQVITAVGPTPPLGFVQLNQLAQAGAILNNVIVWNGTTWVAQSLGSLGLEITANKDAASGYAGLTSGSLLKVAEFPAFTGDCTTLAGTVAMNCTNAIARTGVDINTSNQVTQTHLSAALPVNQGGQGNLTLAAHGVLIGEGTGAINVAAPGTAGWVLTSNGPNADPTMQPAGSGTTDSSYRLFPTAASAPNLGGGSGFISAGWQTDVSGVQPVSGGWVNGLNGILLPKATGTHYAFLFVQVPVGWNSTIGLISTYFLQFSSSGTGTGTHDYALSCFIPGTTNINSAISWTSAVQVNFTVATAQVGAIDIPALTPPTCNPGSNNSPTGAMLMIRVLRETVGTAPDATVLTSFAVSLPHTVQ